jgi:hypothetical protein
MGKAADLYPSRLIVLCPIKSSNENEKLLLFLLDSGPDIDVVHA